jgi:alkyl sulfatase BDS1-like metallo-beta-lactamase superfamily hydrolase
MQLSRFLSVVSTMSLVTALTLPASAQDQRKDATAATKAANQRLLNELPFSDRSDFDNAQRGFIAPLPSDVIKGQSGNTVWNPQQYGFIKPDVAAPDTVNPSLWRQSQLINLSGLFKVADGLYQVRNLDLSNMTIIEGREGITIVDPLVSAETAKVGLDLYYAHRGSKPVKAVIYTHSHVDHYGGVRGVTNETDVTSGKVKIYPATLHELPPVESSKAYVEFMGGPAAVLDKAKQSFDKGDYRWVAQVVNHVIFADPNNKQARDLQADALEQLGYQAESGPWRNFYLTGAKELRDGVKKLPTPNTASPDTVRAMTPEMFFDYLSVRVDRTKAGEAKMALNFDFSGPDGKYLIELENGVLNHTEGWQANNADATVSLTRNTLNKIILQETKLTDAISTGDVKVSGNQAKLNEMVSYLDNFEFWFPIVTP